MGTYWFTCPPLHQARGPGGVCHMLTGLGLDRVLYLCTQPCPNHWEQGWEEGEISKWLPGKESWVLRALGRECSLWDLHSLLALQRRVHELSRAFQSRSLVCAARLVAVNEANEAKKRMPKTFLDCSLFKLCEATGPNSCLVYGWCSRFIN